MSSQFYEPSEQYENENSFQYFQEAVKIQTVNYSGNQEVPLLISKAELKETNRLINKFKRNWKLIAYEILYKIEMKYTFNSLFQGTFKLPKQTQNDKFKKKIVIQMLKDPRHGIQAVQYLLEEIMNQYVKVIQDKFLQRLLNHFFRKFYETVVQNPSEKVYFDFSKLMKSDSLIIILFQICQTKSETHQIQTRSKKKQIYFENLQNI